MERREFVTLLGGIAAASSVSWPLAARAQAAMPVIGVISSASSRDYVPMFAAFRKALGETGYVEGQNVKIEYVWADEQYDRLPALAADLVHRQVSLIVAAATPAALAAKPATSTIPLELMHELMPAAKVLGLLLNPTNPVATSVAAGVQVAATSLGLELKVVHAHTEEDLDAVFASLPGMRVGALVIGTDPFFTSRSEKLGAMSLRLAIPAIYQYRSFTEAGGVMSYGGSITDSYRHAGLYAGRILKGEKPGDLPVQLSTKIELFLNLKSAKALGLDPPLSLLGRADEVIE
jgi:putative ABC transport system substrate-binding protein